MKISNKSMELLVEHKKITNRSEEIERYFLQKITQQRAVGVSVFAKCFGGWEQAKQHKKHFRFDNSIAWLFERTLAKNDCVSFEKYGVKISGKHTSHFSVKKEDTRIPHTVLYLSDRDFAKKIRTSVKRYKDALQKEAERKAQASIRSDLRKAKRLRKEAEELEKEAERLQKLSEEKSR